MGRKGIGVSAVRKQSTREKVGREGGKLTDAKLGAKRCGR